MSENKKVSKAQMQATKRYEDKAYFKTLVRFPADKEEQIRKCANGSLNKFIVECVLKNLDE